MAAIQNKKLFVPVPSRKGVQAGVVIIHSCGTKQWIGNSFYLDKEIAGMGKKIQRQDYNTDGFKGYYPQTQNRKR